MATSLLQSSSVLLSSSSSSSSSSLTYLVPNNIPTNLKLKTHKPVLTASFKRLNHSKRNVIPRATESDDPVTAVIDSLNSPTTSELKLKLLSIVSGLNRGLAANEEDLKKADAAAKELEAVGKVVDLSEDLDKLQGKWKLIYSSAFSSRTLGGSRPGPPTGRLLSITLGQVFQRIDIFSKDFDNIVELQLGAPWPLPPLEATATLAHKFELTGSATVKIVFDKTTVKTTGALSQLPLLELPKIPDALRPSSSNSGRGDFEVTYLDDDTRVTRGDRNELRVFVKA